MAKIPVLIKSPLEDIQKLYNGLESSITRFDCGKKCSVHNPSGKPFCCDICQAVPAAYPQEWAYLQPNTNLWHPYRGDECDTETTTPLKEEIPPNMLLLACLGPQQCQRPFRALSCRQFPFFPYVSSDYVFLGLAYEWEFENSCWVISNLAEVTASYREEFIQTHDQLFTVSQEIFDNYFNHSERMRAHFASQKRRIPLLHRNSKSYLISPQSERLQKVELAQFKKYGFYKA